RLTHGLEQRHPLGSAEPLQKPDQAPSVLLAISKQVVPDLFPRTRLQPVPTEEQPLQLKTRRFSVSDRQPVVAKLWHERREHALEAEAPAEIRVVDVVADNREQVH